MAGEIRAEALAELEQYAGQEAVRQLLELFLQYAPQRMSECRQGLAAGDASKVQVASHSLKSLSGQVGAVRMQELGAEIEALAEKLELNGIGVFCDDLEREFQAVRPRLQQKLSATAL